jgi:integrase
MGELLQVRWEQVDFEAEEIVLRRGETKNQDARVLPFLGDDMILYLTQAKAERDARWPQCDWGLPPTAGADQELQSFVGSCFLHFHDLRRTGVRNMRRAGTPQVVRMKISGHKTDSMKRRYSIVDGEDFAAAKAAMKGRKL